MIINRNDIFSVEPLLVIILLVGCGSYRKFSEYAVEKFYSSLAFCDINSAKEYISSINITVFLWLWVVLVKY